jgi:hypothetical protein
MSLLSKIRRAIFKPKFDLNRQQRRQLQRGIKVVAQDKYGDNYVLTGVKGQEPNEQNVTAKYVPMRSVR